MLNKLEIEEFFARLQKANPNPRGELDYINPYTLLVAVVLSAQATDASVNKATEPLFKIADTPQKMLKLGEAKVNEMNERAHGDAIGSAERDVDGAETILKNAQQALADFRNAEYLIDPGANAQSVLQTITTLSTALANTRAQIAQSSKNVPANPAASALETQSAAYSAGIEAERAKLAGSAAALASKLATYDRLILERTMAEKRLAAAISSLGSARQEARRQQIYIEEITEPNLPDKSTEPRRLRMIATFLVFSFALTAVGWLLVTGSKEHVSE